MPIVVDASVAMCWALQDETQAIATAALERLSGDSAVVPALWWFEVRNALLMNERRGRITERQTAAYLAVPAQFPIAIDRTPDEATILAFARRHRLTAYDAAYLELARRTGHDLATLDRQLFAAAAIEGVKLVGPV